jgi:hypothetical protein
VVLRENRPKEEESFASRGSSCLLTFNMTDLCALGPGCEMHHSLEFCFVIISITYIKKKVLNKNFITCSEITRWPGQS